MINKSTQVVKILDVGHGDSTVIYLNDHTINAITVVMDIPQSDKLLEELAAHNIKVIDLLVITHSDADHCKGINDFLEKFSSVGKVLKVCFNIDRPKPTDTMIIFLKKFKEYYQRYKMQLISGTIETGLGPIKLVELEDSVFSILYPDKADSIDAYLAKNVNNMSIVCMLHNDDYSILFTGDVGAEGWNSIFERYPELKCNILKMPHHGAYYDDSKSRCGTRKILKRLQPEIAVISTGENKRYNHPAAETICVLTDSNVQIYCTEYTGLCHEHTACCDRKCNGDISIIRKGDVYDVETQECKSESLSNPACIKNEK